MFTDAVALSTCSSFLSVPLFVLKRGKQFLPYWLPRVVLSTTKDRHTERHFKKHGGQHNTNRSWAPDNNRKWQHLEIFLAAAGGLHQITLSVLPGAAPERSGVSLAQEGTLPPGTCPTGDTPSTHSGYLGIPLPVLCWKSWVPEAQQLNLYGFTAVEGKQQKSLLFKITNYFIVAQI